MPSPSSFTIRHACGEQSVTGQLCQEEQMFGPKTFKILNLFKLLETKYDSMSKMTKVEEN